MKKVLCIILMVSLALVLSGCGGRQTTEPSSATSAAVATDAVDAVYRITYQWSLQSNDHIGNDWQKAVTCDGRPFNSGDTVAAAEGSRITIECTVTEVDKYPDTGRGAIKLALEDGAQGAAHITVYEGHGIYAGNAAEWMLSCRADRVE